MLVCKQMLEAENVGFFSGYLEHMAKYMNVIVLIKIQTWILMLAQ